MLGGTGNQLQLLQSCFVADETLAGSNDEFCNVGDGLANSGGELDVVDEFFSGSGGDPTSLDIGPAIKRFET